MKQPIDNLLLASFESWNDWPQKVNINVGGWVWLEFGICLLVLRNIVPMFNNITSWLWFWSAKCKMLPHTKQWLSITSLVIIKQGRIKCQNWWGWIIAARFRIISGSWRYPIGVKSVFPPKFGPKARWNLTHVR